jgi:hypothetical protein
MNEKQSPSPNVDLVGYGCLHRINIVGKELTFRFEEKGTLLRTVVEEFAERLGIGSWEFNRTHWAVWMSSPETTHGLSIRGTFALGPTGGNIRSECYIHQPGIRFRRFQIPRKDPRCSQFLG